MIRHTECLFGCSICVSAMMAKNKNPHVFLDLSIDGDRAEKMVFEVRLVTTTSICQLFCFCKVLYDANDDANFLF